MKRDVLIQSVIGPGVPLKNSFVDVAPAYRFVDGMVINWPDPKTFQFENGEVTVTGLEDTYDGEDLVWAFRFRNLDSRNQEISSYIEIRTFDGATGTPVDYATMLEVDAAVPPEFGPTYLAQTKILHDEVVEKAAQVAEVETTSDGILSGLINNPETASNGAVSSLVEASLSSGVTNLVLVFKGALVDSAASRPAWAGIVDWWIYEGDTYPVNYLDDVDVVTIVATTAQEDIPGFADPFSGAAGLLGLTPSGRKPYEFATRTGTGGVTFGRNGTGAAGLVSGTGGNATCAAEGLSADGTITLDLATVTTGNAGILFRYVDYQNYNYLFRNTSSNARAALWQVVAGTATQVGSAASTGFDITTGRKLEVHLSGSSVIVDIDGSTAFNVTLTTNQAGSKHGLYCSPTGALLNYFAANLSFEAA